MRPRTASVSVVMACFNCAATVRRAVASVASQTLLPEELILIDDGSQDGTPAILSAIRDECGAAWIRIISNSRNLGPSQSRNAGWLAAMAEYVAFIDADDSWHPRKLEIQWTWMTQHPNVVLTGHALAVLVEEEKPQGLAGFSVRRVTPWQQLLSNRFLSSSVLIRRDCPLRYREGKHRSEDFLLFSQVVLAGFQAYRFDIPLAYRYKPLYGASGLSGDLWKMESAEIGTYTELKSEGLISSLSYGIFVPLSILIFLRRLVICSLRERVAN